MAAYTIGVDFGTLAVRALVAEVATGRELGTASVEYPHAVMTRQLPDGTALGKDWALQHPQDYVDCLRFVMHEAVRKAGIDPKEVVGLGLDFTASTSIPVDQNGNPLCLTPEYQSNPFAWPMLWKHHAAQKYADRMTEIAQERNEAFLQRCGGRISSELMLPRLWQIAVEAPDVYEAADRFVEAGDWIIQQMTGSDACSVNVASYKLFWDEEHGYPDKSFLAALDERLIHVTDKLGKRLLPLGSKAGEINEYGAELTGLLPGTAVSVTCVDAHACLPAAGVVEDGMMALILGTSGAHLVLNEAEHRVPGLLCMAKDGMIPGFYAYEAGQSCCGDHFKWLGDHFVSHEYEEEAAQKSMGVHELLTQKATKLKPGENGLIVLDWWNGNRSVLMDSELSGMMLGLTLQTRPEEIYRALIEATAYGTRAIIENFEAHGVPIREVRVCGGIARKNPLLMQIYADVLNRPLRVVKSREATALGSAIFAAVAAGCYADISQASRTMGGTDDDVYVPGSRNADIYNELYREYLALHDCFGRGENNVMHRLRELARQQKKRNM